MENRKFFSRADWPALATKLEQASRDPKVSKVNQTKAAVSARRLRKLQALRDKVMARNVRFKK